MVEIFQVAGAIIASIGGSSVIILGLSGWLGKVWASRILESEKKRHNLEIEEFKGRLSKEINVVNSMIDKSVYVTKLQYDKEFSIYLEIWEKLADCVLYTKNLYPIYDQVPISEDDLEKHNIRKWEQYVSAYNDYSNVIIKYAPFYEESLYERFLELRKLCSSQGNLFKEYTFDIKYNQTYMFVRDRKMDKEDYNEIYRIFPKRVEELQNSLRKEIQNHLKSLQTINN